MDFGLLCMGKAVPFPDPFHESVRIEDKANFSVGGSIQEMGTGTKGQEPTA
jgi:hypothetical protein